jgi:GNAT superfamily N-acetyltransferase
MTGLQIRQAAPEDAETIFALIRGLAEFEREPNAVKTTPALLREQMRAASPPFECLLAEQAAEGSAPARTLGFALFFQNYSTWLGKPGLYLEDLFVVPEERSKGVGRALFVAGAKLAVARGCGRYEWAALNWNSNAIEFYRSFGAVPLSEWTTFRLTGAALLQAAEWQDSAISR